MANQLRATLVKTLKWLNNAANAWGFRPAICDDIETALAEPDDKTPREHELATALRPLAYIAAREALNRVTAIDNGPLLRQSSETRVKSWPFLESPGEFANRLWDAYCGKHKAPDSVIAAVRHVLIESPPALADWAYDALTRSKFGLEVEPGVSPLHVIVNLREAFPGTFGSQPIKMADIRAEGLARTELENRLEDYEERSKGFPVLKLRSNSGGFTVNKMEWVDGVLIATIEPTEPSPATPILQPELWNFLTGAANDVHYIVDKLRTIKVSSITSLATTLDGLIREAIGKAESLEAQRRRLLPENYQNEPPAPPFAANLQAIHVITHFKDCPAVADWTARQREGYDPNFLCSCGAIDRAAQGGRGLG